MRKLLLRALIAAAVCAVGHAPRARGATQASSYTSSAITLGTGGYSLNFSVTWSCDDAPQMTVSSPGEIDLIDGNGNLAGQLSATIGGGSAVLHVQGAGSASGSQVSVGQLGAGGTPANGYLAGTWLISGVSPGSYTLRFWFFQVAQSGTRASTITTQAADAGGSGAVALPPTPTPTAPPAVPPTISLAAPAAATVFAPVTVGASAAAAPNGNPLASVEIDASEDNGTTWIPIRTNPQATNPTDNEAFQYSFGQAGAAILRATATDAGGVAATAVQSLSVGLASQPAVALFPPSGSITAGQSIAFTASGGATGNYAWGGMASGGGAAQTVAFPSAGTFLVSVVDSGNGNYSPSAPATAVVNVQSVFYTLSLSATAGGSVSGGGSYPVGALATAAAAAEPGNSFSGWTGDVTGLSPLLTVSMNSSKALTAHFTGLLPQTISFVPPLKVSTASPPFTVVATASSGLPVSVALVSGPASLTAGLVTPSGAQGEVALTATQPGNAQYLPAPPVIITFSIGPPPAGVLLMDDSATTKRTDRETHTTSFRSGPPN